MVVIVDPHLKRTSDYPVYKEASELSVLVKTKDGQGEYEGWCWSGSSSWIDFFNPQAWDWWKRIFKPYTVEGGWSWTQSTNAVHIWNDMNEVLSSLQHISSINHLPSLPCSMDLKSRCPRITFIMVDGNTEMSTTSTECFTLVLYLLFTCDFLTCPCSPTSLPKPFPHDLTHQ